MKTPMEISEELASFLEGGNSIPFGTRDADNRPTAMRAVGARVAADRRSIHVYLPDATSARTLANLRENGRAAVTFSRPSTFRTLQIKGRCVDITRATDADREWQQAYVGALADDLEAIGMARDRTERISYWPSMAVHIVVEEIFEQTPGPGAGNKLGATR